LVALLASLAERNNFVSGLKLQVQRLLSFDIFGNQPFHLRDFHEIFPQAPDAFGYVTAQNIDKNDRIFAISYLAAWSMVRKAGDWWGYHRYGNVKR
jgi:hypothetical protein